MIPRKSGIPTPYCFASVALVLLLTSCGPVHQSVKPSGDAVGRIKRLAVVLPEEGGFAVYYERAKATTTGALMFGLVGAAVSSAYNSSADGEKENAIRAGLADVSCVGLFRDALRRTLEESKRFDDVRLFEKEPDPKELSEFDAVATFRIRQWGFRLIERGPVEKMASFIDLEILMAKPSGENILWDEHQTVIGKEKHQLSDFEGNPELCRREIAGTAEDAGYRMATTLIYR